jgi:tetratricopeptide (TPR) repeat protein
LNFSKSVAQLANRARQWSRTAWALAALFGSLPLASRIFAGVWGFDGALELAVICGFLGIYFHVLGRRRSAALRDTSSMLAQALQLAREGQTERAIALLNQAARMGPDVWQTFQYRGELRLAQGDLAGAYEDFSQAVRLAPGEAHLQVLRERAQTLLDSAGTEQI